MGTDVHASFHYRAKNEETGTDEWRFCEHNYEGNRHYHLFSWLADVRNGYGFAGVPTGNAIKPLAEPRGLPEDCIFWPEPKTEYSYGSPEWRAYWANGGEDYGDHSFTWLTADEILAGIPEIVGRTKMGVLTLSEFNQWDKVSEPESYCGGRGGRNHVTLPANKITKRHIKAQAYADAIGSEWLHHHSKVKYNERYVKEMQTPSEQRGLWSSFYSTPLFGGPTRKLVADRSDATEVWVQKRNPTTRPARQKHMRKLAKYRDRITKVSVSCEWHESGDATRESFAYFTDEVKRLKDTYGEVRFVAGFDS